MGQRNKHRTSLSLVLRCCQSGHLEARQKTIVMIREPSIFAELMIVLWDLVGTTMGPDTGVSSVR